MPLHDIESYFRNYDKETYEVRSQQGAEPSLADVGSFEERIGFRFPAEFLEFAVHPLGAMDGGECLKKAILSSFLS